VHWSEFNPASGAAVGGAAKTMSEHPTRDCLRRLVATACHDAKVIALVGLVVTALASCASPQASRSKVNLSGFPPAFRDGYSDGCQSAKGGAALKRDAARYGNDRQYAMGWRDGFDICRKRPSS